MRVHLLFISNGQERIFDSARDVRDAKIWYSASLVKIIKQKVLLKNEDYEQWLVIDDKNDIVYDSIVLEKNFDEILCDDKIIKDWDLEKFESYFLAKYSDVDYYATIKLLIELKKVEGILFGSFRDLWTNLDDYKIVSALDGMKSGGLASSYRRIHIELFKDRDSYCFCLTATEAMKIIKDVFNIFELLDVTYKKAFELYGK